MFRTMSLAVSFVFAGLALGQFPVPREAPAADPSKAPPKNDALFRGKLVLFGAIRPETTNATSWRSGPTVRGWKRSLS